MAASQQIRHRHHQGQGGGEGSHKNGHYNHSNNNNNNLSTMTSTTDDHKNYNKNESDEFYDEAATVTSNDSTDRHNHQNLTSRLHHHKKSSATAAAAITHNNMDEEHGLLVKSYKSKSSFDKSNREFCGINEDVAGSSKEYGKSNKRRRRGLHDDDSRESIAEVRVTVLQRKRLLMDFHHVHFSTNTN